jgi:hypothetical protein
MNFDASKLKEWGMFQIVEKPPCKIILKKSTIAPHQFPKFSLASVRKSWELQRAYKKIK